MKWIVLLTFFVTGCASMGGPGSIKTYDSKADGIKHYSVEPGWVGPFKVGLHKTSDMPTEDVYLDVATRSNAPDPTNGLTINIDGDKKTFSSVDMISDIDQYSFFHKRYKIDMATLRRMVSGKSVWIKVSHVGQTYSEGEFSKTGFTTAKDGFMKFLAELDKPIASK